LFDRNTVLHQEHHIPVAKGGGYTPNNILPACQSCNLSKGSRDPVEWLVNQFGQRKANAILKRIEGYFAWVEVQA
jgi:5-methylcytosine-specific restriction endonuclease McrA